ncbi:Ger(x)C family spore germination protein [Brevibacillus dissolubilis]|uniref:Ger(x)C family spore germination protein n=1 Tax=Brevibacillus dissolubilis TaxID=1844116 RepID=UPI0011172044|nr:Ger(x)C family spore germination protein [Brevibacillus dissolubilis]
MSKRKLWIFFLIVILVTSGCGFKDIDKRSFVVSVGVDKGKKQKYKVTLKLAIPIGEPKSGEQKFQLISEEKDTIAEAVALMKSRVDKELDFGHTKAIVFGEKLVKEDMREVLDWFLRRRDIQLVAWLGAGKPDAYTVLSMKPKSERIPSNWLFLAFGNTGVESQYIVSIYLFDFYRHMTELGLDALLPVIEAKKEYLKIDTVDIFKDYRAALRLNTEETKNYRIVAEELSKLEIKVKDKNHEFIIYADRAKADYKIHTPKGGTPYLDMQVKINGVIEEKVQPTSHDKPIPLHEYERIANEVVEKNMLALLQKLQKHQVDPIGFGLRYRSRHWNNQNEWKEWKNIYPQLEFRVSVDVHLQSPGGIQ